MQTILRIVLAVEFEAEDEQAAEACADRVAEDIKIQLPQNYRRPSISVTDVERVG